MLLKTLPSDGLPVSDRLLQLPRLSAHSVWQETGAGGLPSINSLVAGCPAHHTGGSMNSPQPFLSWPERCVSPHGSREARAGFASGGHTLSSSNPVKTSRPPTIVSSRRPAHCNILIQTLVCHEHARPLETLCGLLKGQFPDFQTPLVEADNRRSSR